MKFSIYDKEGAPDTTSEQARGLAAGLLAGGWEKHEPTNEDPKPDVGIRLLLQPHPTAPELRVTALHQVLRLEPAWREYHVMGPDLEHCLERLAKFYVESWPAFFYRNDAP